MRILKICHLTSVHSYTDTRIYLKECKSASENGFNVYLIAPNAPTEIQEGVNIIGVNRIEGNRISRFTKTIKDVYKKALEIDADVYHFHDPELIPISLKLKKQGKKVIYDVHEDVPNDILLKQWIPAPLRKTISFIFEKYEKYASKKFDYIITSTDTIRDRFIKYGANSRSLYNYPLLKEFNDISKQKDVKKNKLVCYVGGISKDRGLNQMLDAINLIKHTDVKLGLAGPFMYDGEKIEAQQNKGWRRTEYFGTLNRDGVKDVLSNSIAGLVVLKPTNTFIPSLPIKMFEYMSAGIPVISSNFPFWEEIIKGSDCGICVDPLNSNEISDAISFIIKNPQRAKEMGENGHLAIKERYNWENESKKLISIYNNLGN